jgi:serine/threonine-protein kinase HipA
MDGFHVADLTRRGRLDVQCSYTADALGRWRRNEPIISCSLPLTDRPLLATNYFRGVLPEGRALEALAARAEVAVTDTFALLERYGRDIAGALVISDAPPHPRRFGVAPYTSEALADEIADLDDHPLGVHDDSELSLAGLQNKLLMVRMDDGTWGRPLHGQPSTHILKVDSPGRPGLVRAEFECLNLARSVGLTTIEPELLTLAGQLCLVVARFDRIPGGDEVQRVHQEDLCQASGIGAKYESRNRGGPSFKDAADLLDRHASSPQAELERLLAAATFTLAVGNADAHGKNMALLHDSAETVTLAPLYDTVPTIMWRSLRTDAAMGWAGRFSLENTDRLDVIAEARRWSLAEAVAGPVVTDTLERLRDALASGVIADSSQLARTLSRRVQRLLAGAVPGPLDEPFTERRHA